MVETWTFGRKLAAAFGLAGLVLVVIAVFGYRSTRLLLDSERWVNHTFEVRQKLAQLKGSLVDAETAERGYVITGKHEFLEPYEAASRDIPRVLASLRSATADNPIQQRRLQVMGEVLESSLTIMSRTIDERRTLGLAAATATVGAGDGKRSMDQLRRLLAEADADEQRLLEQRQHDAEDSAAATRAVIVWGCLLGTLLVAGVAVAMARALGRQVGAAVHHIQSSSTELSSAANQQASGAKQQASAMGEISSTISELLETSRQIAESAQRVAQISERTAYVARSGDTTAARGNESVTSMRHHVGLIVNHMLELGKKSQEIGVVLDIVSELAEQTNILAINATIEAVAAGDAGRRFSVVADEIRKLSDRVGGSTKEIRGLIEEVRGAVNTTIKTTETGSKAIEAGSRQFSDVASALSQISAEVTTTTEAAKEIELSTKQQASAVEQVNAAINNVARVTRESESSTRETQRTAGELAGLSRELLRLVQAEPHGSRALSA